MNEKWIKLEDARPEKKGTFIITDGESVTFSYYYQSGFSYVYPPHLEKISHWMPLPKPPQIT